MHRNGRTALKGLAPPTSPRLRHFLSRLRHILPLTENDLAPILIFLQSWDCAGKGAVRIYLPQVYIVVQLARGKWLVFYFENVKHLRLLIALFAVKVIKYKPGDIISQYLKKNPGNLESK